MIYVTQFIFVKEGQEEKFLEYEEHVLPLMESYSGKLLYRVRPSKEHFIGATEEIPFEIHFVSFETDEALARFLKDDTRLNFIHLKDESVKSMILVKGEKM